MDKEIVVRPAITKEVKVLDSLRSSRTRPDLTRKIRSCQLGSLECGHPAKAAPMRGVLFKDPSSVEHSHAMRVLPVVVSEQLRPKRVNLLEPGVQLLTAKIEGIFAASYPAHQAAAHGSAFQHRNASARFPQAVCGGKSARAGS